MDNTIFQIIILIMSVVIHEVSHGYAALWMGDVTAKYAGRLTMNPIKHLDLFGSIILPAFLILTGSHFLIGWAKPVPYNPYNLRNQRWGELVVAIAGPLANVSIAVLMGLFIRASFLLGLPPSIQFINLAMVAIFINFFLAIFNLIPIPPLDGSKVLFNLFPKLSLRIRPFMELYSLVLLIFFIIFLAKFLGPLVEALTRLLLGF
jgi:Zn-dependent protease